ncbi:MAG: DUF3592 domain-containing protein [Anaerolineae bacterium]
MARTGQFFLLDPDNEPFATGASRRLPAGGQGCVLLFLSIFVLVGLFMAADITRRWVHVAMLNTDYAEAEGQVLGREIEDDEGATYYVSYRFVANDQVHTIRENVEKGVFHSMEEGQSATVRYAPRHPGIATIAPGRVGGLLALTGFCVLWDGTVFVISALVLREVLQRRKLARHGQRLVGEVLRSSGHRDSDGDFVLALGYGFCSPLTATRIEGSNRQVRKDLEHGPLPQAGTPVHVLYLDDERHMVL